MLYRDDDVAIGLVMLDDVKRSGNRNRLLFMLRRIFRVQHIVEESAICRLQYTNCSSYGVSRVPV